MALVKPLVSLYDMDLMVLHRTITFLMHFRSKLDFFYELDRQPDNVSLFIYSAYVAFGRLGQRRGKLEKPIHCHRDLASSQFYAWNEPDRDGIDPHHRRSLCSFAPSKKPNSFQDHPVFELHERRGHGSKDTSTFVGR